MKPGTLGNKVKRCGGKNIKIFKKANVVFADMTSDQASELKSVVKDANIRITGDIVSDYLLTNAITPPIPKEGNPTYSPEEVAISTGLDSLRRLLSPPMYGKDINLAVMGTGIRATHVNINNRVVLSKNCTSFPDGDGFDHETGVAAIAVSIAPEVNILDIKIIKDTGVGTEEDAVEGIDYLIGLCDDEDEYAPDVVNMSFGTPDTDPNSALRAATRVLLSKGVLVVSAAGNSGPNPSTVTSPAVEQYVLAVGSIDYDTEQPSEFSSRGPTPEGLVKPDCTIFGNDLVVSSSKSDTATTSKSGTSFTSPFVAGLVCLWQEFFTRTGELLRLQGVPEDYPVPKLTPHLLVDVMTPQTCLKPEGVDPDKDNIYGWGIPLPSMTVQLFGSSSSLYTIIPLMIEVMMIGMMGKVMGEME